MPPERMAEGVNDASGKAFFEAVSAPGRGLIAIGGEGLRVLAYPTGTFFRGTTSTILRVVNTPPALRHALIAQRDCASHCRRDGGFLIDTVAVVRFEQRLRLPRGSALCSVEFVPRWRGVH